MQCGKCKSENDSDALFCEHCGGDLRGQSTSGAEKKNRAFLYILIAAVVVLVGAIGYYKFFLPSGVAAVVNGEEISLAEVDARMQGVPRAEDVPPEILSRARYRILNDLITERIAWQEAKRAGVRIASADIDAAYEQLVASSGDERDAFDALVKDQYGSVRAFRRALERRIAIRRYIDEKIAAGITDSTVVGARVDQWLQEISGKASIRVALAEQLPTSGCGSGGCGSGGCGGSGAGTGGCGTTPRTGANVSTQAKEAQKAALAYWRERYGDDRVEAKVLDFGCHIQVDMMKEKRIAKSLRYQNGTITEL